MHRRAQDFACIERQRGAAQVMCGWGASVFRLPAATICLTFCGRFAVSLCESQPEGEHAGCHGWQESGHAKVLRTGVVEMSVFETGERGLGLDERWANEAWSLEGCRRTAEMNHAVSLETASVGAVVTSSLSDQRPEPH